MCLNLPMSHAGVASQKNTKISNFSENFPGAEHSMSLKMTMHVSDSGHIPEAFENLLLPSPDR